VPLEAVRAPSVRFADAEAWGWLVVRSELRSREARLAMRHCCCSLARLELLSLEARLVERHCCCSVVKSGRHCCCLVARLAGLCHY